MNFTHFSNNVQGQSSMTAEVKTLQI